LAAQCQKGSAHENVATASSALAQRDRVLEQQGSPAEKLYKQDEFDKHILMVSQAFKHLSVHEMMPPVTSLDGELLKGHWQTP
jgi:hypothetical protein